VNTLKDGARGGAVGSGTALQAGKSRVRFPMVSLDFFIDISFQPHYGPGVDWASNRNEYQKNFLEVKTAGAYGWQCYHLCRLSWNPVTLRACPGLYRDCFTFYLKTLPQVFKFRVPIAVLR
jgi:hypothetical protein